MLTTLLKSFDTFVIIASSFNSIVLSLSGIGLIVTPISTGIACGLTIGTKVIYEVVMQNHKNYNKQNQTDQQNIESSDKLYRKSFQDNVIDRN